MEPPLKGLTIVRDLGFREYEETVSAMRTFTRNRIETTPDECWLLEHPPIFTQGIAGQDTHVLNPHDIPVIQTDRGGQVTYHGPGQLVIYVLCDLKRKQWGIRSLVSALENTVVSYLKHLSIEAEADSCRRGVYVSGKKICSIGLRVSRSASYHGLALNVAMDLTPFSYINPCGYAGLEMTQICDFSPTLTVEAVKSAIMPYFFENLRYNDPHEHHSRSRVEKERTRQTLPHSCQN